MRSRQNHISSGGRAHLRLMLRSLILTTYWANVKIVDLNNFLANVKIVDLNNLLG